MNLEKREICFKGGTNCTNSQTQDEHSAECLKDRLTCLTLSWLRIWTIEDISASSVTQKNNLKQEGILRATQLYPLILYPRKPRLIEAWWSVKAGFRNTNTAAVCRKIIWSWNPANQQLSFKGQFIGWNFYSTFSHSVTQNFIQYLYRHTNKTWLQPCELTETKNRRKLSDIKEQAGRLHTEETDSISVESGKVSMIATTKDRDKMLARKAKHEKKCQQFGEWMENKSFPSIVSELSLSLIPKFSDLKCFFIKKIHYLQTYLNGLVFYSQVIKTDLMRATSGQERVLHM